MANSDVSNGFARGSNGKVANGSANGIKTANGQATVSRRKTASRQSPGLFARLVSITARLFTWYAIITILFRCPATLDACTDDSPPLCKPYFHVKQAVSPRLEPYYNTYAAPYVELAKPYYTAVDQTVLTPAWQQTVKYGAPAVAQVQSLGSAQWEKTVQPQLLKYQALAKSKYDEALGPHVNQIVTAVTPYYEIAHTNALQTYYGLLLPSYSFIEPYALQGYSTASAFTTDTIVPTTAWAWSKTHAFLDGTVWPQLRIIYVETVEPQLVKIGQRLGRYNGTSTKRTTAETTSTIASKAASSFTRPTPSSSATTVPANPAADATSVTSETPTPEPSAPPAVEEEPTGTDSRVVNSAQIVPGPTEPEAGESDNRKIAREIVAEDLKAWQEKYAKAADEGAAEIDERINELTQKMIADEAQIQGKQLFKDLQQAVVSGLVELRRDILNIVGAVQKESASVQDAEEQVVAVVRRHGKGIKEKAVAVRTWREEFDKQLENSVNRAAENHFQILRGISDLALQKIGMKWAWMDGISYKDWAKYHLLRERFTEWEKDLEQMIVTHPALEEARESAQTIEDEAMTLAQSAAKELGRLKDAAAWKLKANDATNEFRIDILKAAAEAAEELAEAAKRKAATEASESATPEEHTESTSSSASLDETSTEIASESPIVESVVAEESTIAEEDVEPTFSTQVETIEPSTASSETSSQAEEPSPILASAPILEETPVVVGNTTDATESAEPAPVHLPVDEVGEPEPAEVAEVESEDLPEPSATTSTTATVKPAMFGAAAAEVPNRQPIMDDEVYESVASVHSQISSVASSAFSVASSHAADQYSQAVKLISDSIKGTPQPVHERLLASISSVYSKAMETASSRSDSAVKAATDMYGSVTEKIKPTPTPEPMVDWARIEAIAAERLEQGRAWAEEQYESAKVAIGLATPTPTSPVDRMMDNARHNYYAGLGLAHARYSEFMAAASSAFSSLTATPTPTDAYGTASSLASVASGSASSIASVVGENASSVASDASASVESIASVVGENASSVASVASASAASVASQISEGASSGLDSAASLAAAATGAAVENWAALVDGISERVYGAPTPTAWYETVTSVAAEWAQSATKAADAGASTITAAAAHATEEAALRYDAVSSIVSELLLGKEQGFSESVYSRLNEVYSKGTATVASVVSEATEAVKETVESVKDEL